LILLEGNAWKRHRIMVVLAVEGSEVDGLDWIMEVVGT
jgi:hypothetical protein